MILQKHCNDFAIQIIGWYNGRNLSYLISSKLPQKIIACWRMRNDFEKQSVQQVGEAIEKEWKNWRTFSNQIHFFVHCKSSYFLPNHGLAKTLPVVESFKYFHGNIYRCLKRWECRFFWGMIVEFLYHACKRNHICQTSTERHENTTYCFGNRENISGLWT